MKRLLTCLIGLVALTTSSCALSLLAALPEEAIYQSVNCPTRENTRAKSFQVLSTEKWSEGIVVLFKALCPAPDQSSSLQPVFGHKVVRRQGMNWQVSGTGSYGTDASIRSKTTKQNLIEYGISQSPDQSADRYTILYGRVLKPKVAVVEATFDNGKVVRDRPSNGVFALISIGATSICELRVMGPDNQILQQIDLLVPREISRSGRSFQCLPETKHL